MPAEMNAGFQQVTICKQMVANDTYRPLLPFRMYITVHLWYPQLFPPISMPELMWSVLGWLRLSTEAQQPAGTSRAATNIPLAAA
jgi:hypothetical protein